MNVGDRVIIRFATALYRGVVVSLPEAGIFRIKCGNRILPFGVGCKKIEKDSKEIENV